MCSVIGALGFLVSWFWLSFPIYSSVLIDLTAVWDVRFLSMVVFLESDTLGTIPESQDLPSQVTAYR